MMVMKKITKSILEQALSRMGELAVEAGIKLEVCLYGGALMMLAYDARSITKDVDAILTPARKGHAIARQVGRELGLMDDWLNGDVKVFLAPSEAKRTLPREYPGLLLTAPTAGYLLAMKALACRNPLPGYEGDVADLRFLIGKMGITSTDQVQEWIDQYYPDDVIKPEHTEILNLLIQEAQQHE